jgi:hypothetical protein
MKRSDNKPVAELSGEWLASRYIFTGKQLADAIVAAPEPSLDSQQLQGHPEPVANHR